MRYFNIFAVVFLFLGGILYVHAQDLIVLRDGNMIEAKVMEIHPSDIRYKRIDNLNGPMIILPIANVLSIRYENGTVDNFNAGTGVPQASFLQGSASTESTAASLFSIPPLLQQTLNRLPAIPIAGNNLKFEFGGETWTATLNGANFLAGNVEIEDTSSGCILTLRQTHIWPGTVGQTAGRIASMIPGGAAVSDVLNKAGSVAGALAGAVEASGPVIILEYTEGPPASLKLVSRSDDSEQAPRRESSQTNPDIGLWRNKWVYLGGFLGGGYYGYNGYREYDEYGYYGYVSGISFVGGGIAALDLTKSAFIFDLEAMSLILNTTNGTEILIPLLLRMGGRIGRKVEWSGAVGYTVGTKSGITFAPTLGVNIGPGVLFATPIIIIGYDSYSFFSGIGVLGYKVGLGNRRR